MLQFQTVNLIVFTAESQNRKRKEKDEMGIHFKSDIIQNSSSSNHAITNIPALSNVVVITTSKTIPLYGYARSDFPRYNHNARKPVPHPPNFQSSTATPHLNHAHPSTASSHPTLPSVTTPKHRYQIYSQKAAEKKGGCVPMSTSTRISSPA